MDVTDYRIIEILQKDGRISMKDLGKIVGLTSPAVSERVKRLEESGVIEGYKAIVNPDALGRVIKAFIHISLPSDKYKVIEEMIDFCEKYNITSFYLLSKYAFQNNDNWKKALADNSAIFMKEYLKSKEWSQEKGQVHIVNEETGEIIL